ncbi:MAG TPA: sigma-54 dependent transcriptional regulator [Spirochaetia bacterium]|nr:sigma-54-dependent Fis family transcriptional regulator [Spirochaetaceae bacterium]HPE88083.1 sigma-54 dependent transcriptional regulator [Spirochaetales bacterium]HRW22978.1 sigma-54 dependent transcriptional regulator [Spirochaetia bacterium]
MRFTVLVVDDEKNIREGLGEYLRLDGYDVELAADGREGVALADRGGVDLVITDLRMPALSGGELLKHVVSRYPSVPVIVLTGHGTVEDAVDAMRSGAYDFITKPVNLDHLSILVKRALERRELSRRNEELLEEIETQRRTSSIIGKSPAISRIMELVRRVAPTKASVLITGESGVGKELVADAIHNLSPRADGPFVKVHCAALAESLLESELFGHEKGSFTGAQARKKGRFELANDGTLFLDEIGEINQNVQIKILRVLQDKRFERVGGEETIETDVRVVAATNRDLKEEIAAGRFREDLYYRLNVVNIHVPPLRERKDDIPLLAGAFLREFAEDNGKAVEGFDPKARAALYAYAWPGNVRELRNCIESAVVMASGGLVTLDDLPPGVSTSASDSDIRVPPGSSLADAERILIRETLAAQGGNKSRSAEILGIGRKTLYQKIQDYGLEPGA